MDRIKKMSINAGILRGQIPRKKTATMRYPPAQTRQTKKPAKAGAKPENCEIRRDSRKQLNVSAGGEFYEKAKSRRTRQKVALEQSGNQDSAVPLGKNKRQSVSTARAAKSFEVEDLGKQLEHKSFVRRASITHGLKRQQKVHQEEQDSGKVRKRKQPLSRSKIYRKAVTNGSSWNSRVGLESELQPQTKSTKRNERSSAKQDKRPDNHVSMAQADPEVIDLLSSDSESETCEDDTIQTLTQLLRDEAIGRGANRKEMEFYAHQLFQLGLHSREMILDALNMNSDNVESWKWMKPFHKTVFRRWFVSQQKQQTGTKKKKK